MGLHSHRPVRVPMLTPGHVSIRTGPWSNGRRWPGLMNDIFWIAGWVCIAYLGNTWHQDGKKQNNAPCHKAQMIQEWFDEHNNEFEVFTWPPNSPDLNPIEHLWDVQDKQV
ncbi:hypothetical protein QTP70_035168 [Hemibagrus guttatus]|uniref:Tc1-like transposase DDE domain-containing protein n=1 Tax=Hemibagrus guttatus TaxID=175788 RepID=A0AAE0PXA1_9TELE|nr:hypothetical protein QTP70_035168 [Hemibagrus guttatus]KAK3527626.1 hypothetical protein QTP86_030476 [Hemibagrus guttatus]